MRPIMENSSFAINLTLSIETYYKAYLTTKIIGWRQDEFILTDAVYSQGKPAYLNTKDICKIRFLKDGVAYGFETEVLTVQFYPFPVMFLKFPAKMECLKLRVAPRFKIDMPITFLDASGQVIPDAIMTDISEGGCGLKIPVQENRNLTPEGRYKIECKLMDKEIRCDCSVKRLDKQEETCFIGTEFLDMTTPDKETLKIFLDFLNKYAAR
jgi:c-di-GMP-binding flagellar brake protein YcgR